MLQNKVLTFPQFATAVNTVAAVSTPFAFNPTQQQPSGGLRPAFNSTQQHKPPIGKSSTVTSNNGKTAGGCRDKIVSIQDSKSFEEMRYHDLTQQYLFSQKSNTPFTFASLPSGQ